VAEARPCISSRRAAERLPYCAAAFSGLYATAAGLVARPGDGERLWCVCVCLCVYVSVFACVYVCLCVVFACVCVYAFTSKQP